MKPTARTLQAGPRARHDTLGEKKTATLMASDRPDGTSTLVGCYYTYEK